MIAQAPNPAAAERDGRRGAGDGRCDRAHFELAKVHGSHEERTLNRAQTREKKAQSQDGEQRLYARRPVERRHGTGNCKTDAGEHGTGRDRCPEERRAISVGDVLPLHERRPEAKVGEDQDKARNDEDHPREPVGVRREKTGQGYSQPDPRHLQDQLRCELP